MVRGVCIYNPASRNAVSSQVLRRLAAAFESQGYAVQFQPTKAPLHAIELASAAASANVDLVFACGGDGTIREVASGLAGSSVPLGILPAGMVNVLAWELGVPRHPLKAATEIPRLKPQRIALGKCGADYFMLMGGIGLDASIIQQVSPSLKARFGRPAFFLHGIHHVYRGRFPKLDVAIGGKKYSCSFAVVGRARRYGGPMQITRNARLLSDQFDVCLFCGDSRLNYLKYLGGVFTASHHKFSDVLCLPATEVEVSSDEPVPVQIDGELCGTTPARFKVVKDALTLLVPPKFERA